MMNPIPLPPGLFLLGRILITPSAEAALDDAGDSPVSFLARHVTGDWGEVDPDDAKQNVESLAGTGRLHSVYQTGKQVPFWIITEWDRSVTTILLPKDY